MNIDKYPVNRGANNNLPVKENILTKATELLETYTQKHSKALVIRFDVRYPEGYKTTGRNHDIVKLAARMIQKYKRLGLDPHYIWTREQETSKNPHYHFCLLLNGHKTQQWYYYVLDIETLWSLILNNDTTGCINFCNKDKYGKKQENGIILDRAKPEFKTKFNRVHHHISYLAKEKGKGYPKDGIRDFGMSSRLEEKRKIIHQRKQHRGSKVQATTSAAFEVSPYQLVSNACNRGCFDS